MKKRSETIFVKVLRNGFIPQLGMCGPIPNPIKITRGTAYNMIVAGVKVFEYNPVTKETTELTVDNVFADGVDKKQESGANNVSKPVIPDPAKTPEPVKPVTLNGVKKESEPVNDGTDKKEEDKKVENTNDTKKDSQAPTKNTNNKEKDNKKK